MNNVTCIEYGKTCKYVRAQMKVRRKMCRNRGLASCPLRVCELLFLLIASTAELQQ